jgi:hypothetical protein
VRSVALTDDGNILAAGCRDGRWQQEATAYIWARTCGGEGSAPGKMRTPHGL